MSHIRVHAKTGILWYRRVVPLHLRGYVPSVVGFEDKPHRTEFSKSLRTKSKADANRLAPRIDALVELALQEAAQGLRRSGRAFTGPAPQMPVTAALSPALAYSAISRWHDEETATAEQRLFNGDEAPSWVESSASADTDIRYNLQQFGTSSRSFPDLWRKVPDFDGVLCRAFATQNVRLAVGHPAIPRVRSAFALAWYNVLRAIDHMRLGTWDWKPEPVAPPATAAVPAKAGIGLDAKVEDWRGTLDMRPRQRDMYVSDVRRFAAEISDADTESLTKERVQNWVTARLTTGTITVKAMRRQLSAIRLYWRYLKAHGHTSHETDLFASLYMRDGAITKAKASQKKAEYQPEEVIAIWRAARDDNRDVELAKLIRLAAFTGARIESLCSLKVSEVIVDPKSKIKVIVFNDKTEAGNRSVPIPDAFSPFVQELVHNSDKDGYLIRSTAKNKYDERSAPLGKRYGRLKTALRFGPEYDFHSIRRTVATLLEASGCPENYAADILGHDKPTMTYGVYSGGTPVVKQKQFMDDGIVYPDAEFMGR